MVKTLQVNGSRGEITPLLHARVDTEFYAAGDAQALNPVVTRYGPHTRVPGTLFDGFTKTANRKSRTLPFEFSETQLYSMEFGHLYVRFWTPEGQVMSGGVPYEIASIYTETDLPFIHVRQSGDTVYVFCNGRRPMILRRLAETNWTFTQYVPKDGPYDKINDTATTLSPADTLNAVAKMSDNTTPSPYVASSSGGGSNSYIPFSRAKDAIVSVSATQSGHLTIDLGTAKVVDNYQITSSSNNHYTDAMFSQWDMQGSTNGSSWITIDSRDGEDGWAGSETRYFETTNRVAYRYYRLLFSGGGNETAPATQMGGWYMHQAASDQTPFNLNASSIVGINNGTGFQATDVGRVVRLRGGDGLWRWAEIRSYVNPTRVTVVMHGQAYTDGVVTVNWRLGAWSDTTGWPRTGRFFEDRLAMASWPTDPIGMALSVSAAYDDFRTSSPAIDDDALTLRMTGGRLDPIYWLAESNTLLAGTGGGLRSIGGRNNNEVLKNDNIRQRLEASTAASSAQPTQTENVTLFVDRLLRRLYEVGYAYEADGFVAREVSVLNDHLFKPGIEQIDFVDAPYKTVIARRTDGKLVFFAYDREQKIAGGTLVDVGGVVEDIMVLPGRGYPDVWMTVARTRPSGTVRHIERLAPFWDGIIDANAMPVYAACAYRYEGAATGALSGLLGLAGQTVGIWADGQDIGSATVSNAGAVTLPYAKTAARIVVGQRMPWRIQTLRLPTIGGTGGIGNTLRIANVAIDLYESARVHAGGLDDTMLLLGKDYVEQDPDLPEPILTETIPAYADDSFANGGVCVIHGDSMFPATIRAISLEVEGEP